MSKGLVVAGVGLVLATVAAIASLELTTAAPNAADPLMLGAMVLAACVAVVLVVVWRRDSARIGRERAARDANPDWEPFDDAGDGRPAHAGRSELVFAEERRDVAASRADREVQLTGRAHGVLLFVPRDVEQQRSRQPILSRVRRVQEATGTSHRERTA